MQDPQLRPFALLDWLEAKYNPPAGASGDVVINPWHPRRCVRDASHIASRRPSFVQGPI
jgi:hypothetical protein